MGDDEIHLRILASRRNEPQRPEAQTSPDEIAVRNFEWLPVSKYVRDTVMENDQLVVQSEGDRLEVLAHRRADSIFRVKARGAYQDETGSTVLLVAYDFEDALTAFTRPWINEHLAVVIQGEVVALGRLRGPLTSTIGLSELPFDVFREMVELKAPEFSLITLLAHVARAAAGARLSGKLVFLVIALIVLVLAKHPAKGDEAPCFPLWTARWGAVLFALAGGRFFGVEAYYMPSEVYYTRYVHYSLLEGGLGIAVGALAGRWLGPVVYEVVKRAVRNAYAKWGKGNSHPTSDGEQMEA